MNELCCQRGPQTTVDCESKKLSWISVVSFVILNSGATASGYCLRCIRDCCHSASSRNHDLRLDPLSTVLLQGFQLQKHTACHVLLMVTNVLAGCDRCVSSLRSLDVAREDPGRRAANAERFNIKLIL